MNRLTIRTTPDFLNHTLLFSGGVYHSSYSILTPTFEDRSMEILPIKVLERNVRRISDEVDEYETFDCYPNASEFSTSTITLKFLINVVSVLKKNPHLSEADFAKKAGISIKKIDTYVSAQFST